MWLEERTTVGQRNLWTGRREMEYVTKGDNEQNGVTKLAPFWVVTLGTRQRWTEQSGERLMRPSSSSGPKMARPKTKD